MALLPPAKHLRGVLHGLHAVRQQVGRAPGVDQRTGGVSEVGRGVLVFAFQERIDDRALRVLMPDAVAAHAFDRVQVLVLGNRQRLPRTRGEMVAGADDGSGRAAARKDRDGGQRH